MSGERKYTRIPPASTGDRITHEPHALVPYDGLVGNFILDTFVTFQTSGITAHIHSVYPETGTTGFIGVHYDVDSEFAGTNPTPGENINDSDGVLIATIRLTPASIDLFTANNIIVGKNNPDYGVNVDQFGSIQTTFAEGQPQLDAFGKLRSSGATHLGEYVYSNADELYENYSRTYLNKGSRATRTAAVTHDSTAKYIQAKVETPQDFAAATSNTYHHYIPGSSHLFMGTMKLNDAGKINEAQTNSGTERQFGLFDANDGFMFRVGPTGRLYLVRRSSVSGTTTNYILASSDTSDGLPNFNGDRLDGSSGGLNPSGMDMDLTKDNIFWIDVQWHGAGRIRFGTYHRGQRIVIHEYYHGNTYEEPMTSTASLPVCQAVYFYSDSEMQNHAVYGDGSGTGGSFAGLPAGLVRLGLTATAASGERYLRSWSASVWTETEINLQSLGRPKVYTSGHLQVNGAGFRPIFSLSPRELLSAGNIDHSLFVPTKLTAYAYDNAVTGSAQNREAIVHFRIGVNCVHSGHEFADIPGTNFQVSTAGTSFEGTNKPGNTKTIEFEDMFNGRFEDILTDRYINIQNGSFKNFPDDGGVEEQTISDITANVDISVGAAADATGNSTTLLLDDQSVTLGLSSSIAAYATTFDIPSAQTSSVVIGGTISGDDGASPIVTPLWPEGTSVLDISGNTVTVSQPSFGAISSGSNFTHIGLIEGAGITGSNIPADTVIKSVDSGTQVTLSQATTGTFSGAETLTMTRPTTVTIDPSLDDIPTDRWVLREPQEVTFPLNSNSGALHLHGITGSGTNPFPRTAYIKIISLTKAFIYADSDLTQLIDTSAFTYSSGGVVHGFKGSRVIFTFFAHEQIKNMQDPRVMFSLSWKEILQ